MNDFFYDVTDIFKQWAGYEWNIGTIFHKIIIILCSPVMYIVVMITLAYVMLMDWINSKL